MGILLDIVESVERKHADEIEVLENRIKELETELTLTEELLERQHRLMDVIPECPAHGNRCIPHAIEWVTKITRERPPASGDLLMSNTVRYLCGC